MQKYVIVFAAAVETHGQVFVLTKKDRPEWQAGKLNLPGGKMEEGETPEEAAIRELKEETGLEPCPNPHDFAVEVMGRIEAPDAIVYCVRVDVFHDVLKPAEGETEVSDWINFWNARRSGLLLPNLQLIIPLVQSGVMDWVITTEGTNWEENRHNITISLPM